MQTSQMPLMKPLGYAFYCDSCYGMKPVSLLLCCCQRYSGIMWFMIHYQKVNMACVTVWLKLSTLTLSCMSGTWKIPLVCLSPYRRSHFCVIYDARTFPLLLLPWQDVLFWSPCSSPSRPHTFSQCNNLIFTFCYDNQTRRFKVVLWATRHCLDMQRCNDWSLPMK